MANKINERGQISGMAIVRSGPDEPDIHAFVATAVSESMGLSVADAAPIHPKSNLPVNLDKQRLQRFGLVRAIKGILGASAPCIVSHKLHEGARSKVVRDNIGHTKIDVTQNIYARAGGKCEWIGYREWNEQEVLLRTAGPDPPRSLFYCPTGCRVKCNRSDGRAHLAPFTASKELPQLEKLLQFRPDCLGVFKPDHFLS
jgi:hypothetical protein